MNMEKSLLVFPSIALNKLGFLRPSGNPKYVILQVVAQLMLVSNAVVSIVNFFYFKGDIFQLIDNIESIASLLQISYKMFYFFYFKNKILKLIGSIQSFWNSDNCSESTKNEVRKIASVISFFQKIFAFMSLFAVLLFVIPYSYLKKKLPLGTFDVSEQTLNYNIYWVWYSLGITVASIAVVSIDGMLLGLFYTVILQFKILCDHLERLDVEIIDSKDQLISYQEKLERYIEHQKYLLRYVKELQDISSVIFAVQYLTTAPILCSELYAASVSSNISSVIQHGVLSLETVAQLSFYCIPADYLIIEMLKVADAIYNSNWYGKHFIALKKCTQLMIQRAQQEIRLSALGIVDMNSKTLITVLRMSFSICTVLRNLQNLKY